MKNLPGGVVSFLLFVNLLVFFLGFFLDYFEIVFIIVPLMAPIALNFGFDLVWFGGLTGNVSAQFSRPEDAIKYRKSVMLIIAHHFGRLGDMVKGVETYEQVTPV